jgi:thioredoxin reductase
LQSWALARSEVTRAASSSGTRFVERIPTGSFYKTDPTKETTVPGVFACGDAALAMTSVSFAVADGVRAGAFAHQSLVFRTEPRRAPTSSAAAP